MRSERFGGQEERSQSDSSVSAAFPSTRYQGSKAKLAHRIWARISGLKFHTCLDAFGGTGVVAYHLKQKGKAVTYNDVLTFNYLAGSALIENAGRVLTARDLEWIVGRHREITYSSFCADTFHDIYLTDEENAWIDRVITNIRLVPDPFKRALAFFALCQACIIKRPYNLFHRKNLYLRFAEVKRSFGNKVTWDKPFEHWFRTFAAEANQAVFDNGSQNRALNLDAMAVPGRYDLVYVDTPYISRRGVAVDYLDFYHFLEGLAHYDQWPDSVDRKCKHLRFKKRPSPWTDRHRIHAAFDELFRKFRDSILVVSYRSDGIPSPTELAAILARYKRNVDVERFGRYRYVLSTNGDSQEMLLIGT